MKDPQDEVGGTKSVVFTEAVNLDGVPDALQDIAHNPGNKLSTKRRRLLPWMAGPGSCSRSI